MPLQTAPLIEDEYTQADIAPAQGSADGADFAEEFSRTFLGSWVRGSELSTARKYGGLAYGNLAPDAARAWVAEQGLSEFLPLEERTYNPLELSIIARRKREELRRQAILSRLPNTPGVIARRFMLSLAAQMLSPPDIALAFIPVVGEAKYARLLAQAGPSRVARAAVRARVGAVEGGVGALVTEPIVYAAKKQELADYTLADSLLNIGLGTVFGGGLHAVGGAIGDAARAPGERRARELFDRLKAVEDERLAEAARLDSARAALAPTPEEARVAAAMRSAREELAAAQSDVARVAGETLDVESRRLQAAVDAPDARAALAQWGDLETRLTAARQEADTLATSVSRLYEPQAVAAEVARLSADARYVAGLRRRFNQQNVSDRIERQARENIVAQRTALEAQLAERRAVVDATQRQVDAARTANAAQQRLERIRVARSAGDVEALLDGLPSEVETRLRSRLDAAKAEAARVLNTDEARTVEARLAQKASDMAALAGPEAREAALRAGVAQAVTGRPIDVEGLLRRDMGAVRRTAQPDPDRAPLADPEAVRRVDETLAEGEAADLAAVEARIAELDEEIRALEAEAKADEADDVFPADIREELDAAKEAANEATLIDRAGRMLAACAVRFGS